MPIQLDIVAAENSSGAADAVATGTNNTTPAKDVDPMEGIVIPPPDIRNIVDKTAAFVARNGTQFEERIRDNERSNPRFGFLNPDDPYHGYYRRRIQDIGEGRDISSSRADRADGDTAKAANNNDASNTESVSTRAPPKEPPPFEFSAEMPTLSALDLDIIKLTAQFVARNGRQFMSSLAQREQRNYQFDFLRPNHSFFPYFTHLVEQYTKVLLPPKELKEKLNDRLKSKHEVLEQVMERVRYVAYREAERKKAEDMAEKERVAFLSIDWHDFVVVETVEFTEEDEAAELPPPLNLHNLKNMTLEQRQLAATVPVLGDSQQTGDDDHMDVEEDMVESDAEEANAEAAAPAQQKRPDMSAQIRIRRDYVPKARLGPSGPKPEELTQICVRCGQAIPVSEMDEHVRVELLDPRWREQKQAAEAKNRESNLIHEGAEVDKLLKNISGYRSDIFGADEEVGIGRKVQQDLERQRVAEKQKVIWDGHTATAQSVMDRASVGMTIEEQMAAIQRNKVLNEEANRIGPQVSSNKPPLPIPPRPPAIPDAPPMPGMRFQYPPPLPPPPYAAPGTIRQPPPPGTVPIASSSTSSQPPPPPGVNPSGAPSRPPGPPGTVPQPQPTPPTQPAPPTQPVPAASSVTVAGQRDTRSRPAEGRPAEAPDSKKARVESTFVPERTWIAEHPSPITLTVKAVKMSDKTDGKLAGQSHTVTDLSLELTIATLKDRIATLFEVPAGKQKLTSPPGSAAGPNGLVMKNQLTLAYYNLKDGDTVMIGLKERGGRR